MAKDSRQGGRLGMWISVCRWRTGDDHLRIVEAAGGDPQLAAAHVLGAEAGRAAGTLMAQEVASILVKGMNENLVT